MNTAMTATSHTHSHAAALLHAASRLATTSQTVGPYLHIGLAPRNCSDIAFDGRIDQPNRIVIAGSIVDGDGNALLDGMIEIWQAGADGRYAHPHDARSGHDEASRSADGFGRMPTDDQGRFRFTTIKPGRVPAPDGSLQAPHLIVAFFARGLLKHLSTRLYFADEVDANAQDFVLKSVPASRRETLIAESVGANDYRWTLTLQGAADRETVFFAF
jgi:protocatechuate 3,4-dioxygenase alpha subunit